MRNIIKRQLSVLLPALATIVIIVNMAHQCLFILEEEPVVYAYTVARCLGYGVLSTILYCVFKCW